ncbi:T9SS type A sorting domain-containing protein [Mucilaginibacter sp. L196]|uniref:T9SS type A sorting domain-containing protein n=1 Tax=Mucilaginibacter sp. L196 TaxID=1641870 RepID=UPI00131BCB5B|nr:T9SS type A sorting domain-containing protein [Mucilaginibacter sp. L196]
MDKCSVRYIRLLRKSIVVLLCFYSFNAFAQTTSTDTATAKIPIDSSRWYQLNNVSNGLGGLFDGNLTNTVNVGYGLLFPNFDAYYPVLPGEKIDITQIEFYNYQGGLGAANPLTVSVIDSTGARIPIATYVGGGYMQWDGPIPGTPGFALAKPMNNIKYIVINAWYQYPTEMEFYGHYTAPPTPAPVVPKAYPLNQYCGINGFEWDFEDPNNPLVVSALMLTGMESFTQFRHYMDWNKLESTQGEYTYDPVHSGGWNYDALYAACKANNIFVLADLKGQPNWLMATWPTNQQDSENVPVPYGSDFSDPNSYILQAKVAFQYAARYGANGSVSSSLLSVDPSIRWTDDPANVVKKGTALIQYIECDNERDKWWKGTNAYQTSYEYAANMSAFYDGNMNAMGPGVGVKNADATMQVVMGGLASADPSYVQGMIDWCKLHRGYKADGTVNLCWDVINYHFYSNNGVSGGVATTGVAPELSGTMKTAQAFVKMSHLYAHDMPVWVTESGYDVNSGSPQRAPAIGSKTALQVEADWILRTSMLYARAGVARLFFYEAYDDNPTNPIQYGSSGLLNPDFSRRPAANYLYELNKQFGNYLYKQSLSSNPIVDQYQDSAKVMYALAIPDQVGRTASYTLNLGTADSAIIYSPSMTGNMMSSTAVKLTGGKLTVNVTETPTFVVPVGIASGVVPPPDTTKTTVPPSKPDSTGTDTSTVKTPASGIGLYPNPTSKYVTVVFSNNNLNPVIINITDVGMGISYAVATYQKPGNDFSETLDLGRLHRGVWLVQIKQRGSKTIVKKLIKTSD